MHPRDDEEAELRSVALKNARSILIARRRAEEELVAAREALREETRVLELLNDTGAAIAAELDLSRLLQRVTDSATELSGARFGAFFRVGEEIDTGKHLQPKVLTGISLQELEALDLGRHASLFDALFRSDAAAGAEDSAPDRPDTVLPGTRGTTDDPALRSYLAMPVRSRSGETLGGLFFGHPEPGAFSERVERLVAAVAGQAGVAIDNARLYESAQRDAEERRMLLESERSARADAERMSELKDEFLATLSHELRTPLNAIVGWANVVKSGARDPQDLTKGLDIIESNARMLAQMIDDLLDMSRITSGKMRLDVQAIAPSSFIEAAVETVRPAADAKRIRLEINVDPEAGPISGDPSRLQQVVWNILSNAIKFTPSQGRVQVSVERVGSDVEITVADTGVGISQDFSGYLFERFRQADASTTRQQGGLGLGLSIVKQLVELHGGSAEVTSRGEGQGTTATIRLPLLVARPREADARHDSPPLERSIEDFPPASLEGVKVLVVDDQPEARELIQRILEDGGAEVLVAASAAEALALVEDGRPDVLLSDIGMPDADGYELLRRVRGLGNERGGGIPAIALTAFARSEDRARALRAGFSSHVVKPVVPAELTATVAGVVAGEEATPADRLGTLPR